MAAATMVFTRDGKSVEYDALNSDPLVRWGGDPDLIAEFVAVLEAGEVSLAEPGFVVTFDPENPAYNVTAAAIALGCDLVGENAIDEIISAIEEDEDGRVVDGKTIEVSDDDEIPEPPDDEVTDTIIVY